MQWKVVNMITNALMFLLHQKQQKIKKSVYVNMFVCDMDC